MATLLIFAAFVFLAVVCTMRPYLILGPALCMYGFEQLALVHSPFFRAHPRLVNFGFGVLCLMGVTSLILQGRNPFRAMPLSFLMLWFMFMLSAASVIWSVDPSSSFYFLTYFLPYIAAFAVLAPLCIQTEDELHKSLHFTLGFGTLVMVLLILTTSIQDTGRSIEIAESVVNRAGRRSTTLNPLSVAEMAGQLLIIVTLLNYSGVHRIWQFARWFVALAAMIVMVRSGSRGQLIGSFFAIAWLIGSSRGYKRHFQVFVGVFTLIALIGLTVWSFSLAGAEKFTQRWELERMSESFTDSRVQMCAFMLDAWIKGGPLHWLLGLGSSAAFSPSMLGIYPHVLVVEILTELGLLGIVLLFTYWWMTYRDVGQAWRIVQHDAQRRGVVTAMAALFTYAVILSFKQGNFLSHTYMMMFSFIIGRLALDVKYTAALAEKRTLQRRLLARLRRVKQRERHALEVG